MTTQDVKTAFVTGGSGYVGERLVERLRDSGWRVVALARTEASARGLERPGVAIARGDLDSRAALAAGMAGCDVVFHVAAHFKLWGRQADFDRVNVGGVGNLLAAARDTPSIRRLVHVSAAAVVMGDPAPIVAATEDLPLQQRRFAPYAASKAEAERLVLAADGARADFETIALRPPFIWGGAMPSLDRIAATVAKGRFRWVAGGLQETAHCHIDNLCHALILAATQGRPGHAYFVADDETHSLRAMITALLATRSIAPPDTDISFPMAWRMAGVAETLWRLFRLPDEPPMTRAMLRLIGMPFTVSIEKARRELGYAPVISWPEGLAAMRREPSAAGQASP